MVHGGVLLIGFYFDWFLVMGVGAIWAGFLSQMPGAPRWAGRWVLVIGLLYTLCWAAGTFGMMQAVGAPPPVDGASGPPAGAALMANSRLGVQAVVLGGYVWLLVMTAQTFVTTPPPKGAKKEEESGEG